ncbi:two-component system sporulation sensor kinase A [Metabacillus crassostreae]|uniref:PAS domain S-box protein n=1 Tax=Metabacillus crassostreae TaxID=929098 RepID=UPI00195E2CE7|nr:PAS domain S-box protein [Metabacillus crassostreae]MBM7603596.1 two-component system sporulation sensor kinase A [Metabacillus crassostreae]
MDQQSAYRETTNQNIEIYAIVSSSGRFQYISSNSYELIGFKNDEVVNKYMKEFIHIEDLFLIESYFHNEHHLYPCSFRFLCKNGTYIWFEACVDFIRSSIKNEGKEVILKMKALNTNNVASNKNVYKKQDVINELDDINGNLLIEDLPSPLILATQGKVCYVNRAFQELLGSDSKEKFIGNYIYDFIEHSFHDIVKNRIQRLHNGEQVGIIEQLWNRTDGSTVNVEVLARLTEHEGKNAELIILTDISSKRNFQKILQKSRERYQRLIDNSIDMIAVIHQDKWVFVNEAGIKLFQAGDYQEMLGRNIYRDLHPEDHYTMKAALKSILDRKMEVHISNQSWLVDSKKKIFTEMVCIPTTYFGEQAVQVILRDISDRKKTEELMLRSEKLSIAGQLAAGIAHEIRNPLTAIKGFLQIMKPDMEQHSQYYQIIFSELNRIELILSELLMLAKPQETQFKKTNIVTLLQEVAMLLETQANMNSVFIEEQHTESTLSVYCDENQLKQVFINLFKNAIDAMTSGGKVSVSTKRERDKVVVSVKDEGEGISSDLIERIGEPFLTTKENGNGLGLMITYKIIEDHKGNILVDSEIGMGTTFIVELPCDIA